MDGECHGEVLERWASGAVLVKRIAVHIFPDKFRLFDTLELAKQWATKEGHLIDFNG